MFVQKSPQQGNTSQLTLTGITLTGGFFMYSLLEYSVEFAIATLSLKSGRNELDLINKGLLVTVFAQYSVYQDKHWRE